MVTFLLIIASAIAKAGTTSRAATAGMIVRSKEYVVRRAPQEQEEFIGNVSYKHGDREAQADWALFDHKLQLWRARGNVHGSARLKGGDVIEAWGDVARYDIQGKRGTLEGKDPSTDVRFLRTSPELGLDRGTARRLDWSGELSKLDAQGRVHLWGPEGEAWAENASYDRLAQTLVLTGRRPVVRYQDVQAAAPRGERRQAFNGAVQGDRVIGHGDSERLEAHGSVAGWVLLP